MSQRWRSRNSNIRYKSDLKSSALSPIGLVCVSRVSNPARCHLRLGRLASQPVGPVYVSRVSNPARCHLRLGRLASHLLVALPLFALLPISFLLLLIRLLLDLLVANGERGKGGALNVRTDTCTHEVRREERQTHPSCLLT